MIFGLDAFATTSFANANIGETVAGKRWTQPCPNDTEWEKQDLEIYASIPCSGDSDAN